MRGQFKAIPILVGMLLLATTAFADWTGSTSEPENTKKINGKVFYVITSAEELAWFAEQVNGGRSMINAVLANDIRFMDDTTKTSSVNWTPIGKDSAAMFDGIFDGAGKTIYGLYSNQDKFAGMFGVTDSNAVVKNVALAKDSIRSSSKYAYAGGIVAFNNGRIENCANGDTVSSTFYSGGIAGYNRGTITGSTNSGAVFSSTSSYTYAFSGGIAGYNRGTITGCANSGAVSSSNSATSSRSNSGGIAGYNRGTITGCANSGAVSSSNSATSSRSNSGGIAGWNDETITDCTNGGAVSAATTTSSSHSKSGGITSYNRGTIMGCTNSGAVSASNSSHTSSFSYFGGIAGWNAGTITGCMNGGAVSAPSTRVYNSNSGGIAGWNAGTITGCMNGGAVSDPYTIVYNSNFGGIASWNAGTISDCKNWGSVRGGGLSFRDSSSGKLLNSFSVANKAGYGVIYTNEGTVINCYYDSDVLTGKSTVAPNSGLHTSDMQSDRFAWVLNTTNGTAAHSGVWSRDSVGYPVFADSLHLPIYKVVFDDSGATANRYTNYKGRVSFPENPEAPEGKMFSGWYTTDGVKVKATTVFTKDQTVHAVYINASDIYFSIRFFDSDTTLLDSQYVQYGKTPGYAGTPTKASTAQFSYVFKGWHVEPTAATEDFDYYAVYSETLRSYTVRFLDFDGTELQSGEVDYGKLPSYAGTTPTKASSAEYAYMFIGWDPAINTVKGPADYTAVFALTLIPQSSGSVASSSSEARSSSSEEKSSSSSAKQNSSSSSESPDALVANLPAPEWSVTASGSNFRVHAAPVGKPYALFDLQGKVLAKGRIESPEMTILAPRAGSYVVRVGNRSVRVNAK